MGSNPGNECQPLGDELSADEIIDAFYKEDDAGFILSVSDDHADDLPEEDKKLNYDQWAQIQRDTMVAVLDKVRDIVTGARNKAYGAPFDNHECTGEMWTSYLKRCGLLKVGARITGRMVCNMMESLKISRDAHWEQEDNPLDTIGYAANALACSVAEQLIREGKYVPE